MEQIASVTVTQILKLFLFMILGYICGRKKLFPADADKTLSLLCTCVFLPAMCFSSFCQEFTPEALTLKLRLMLLGAAVLLAVFALSFPLSRLFTRNKEERPIYLYCLTISNSGFMGMPLVLAVFGSAMLSNLIVYTIPHSILIYSVFTVMLNPNAHFSPKAFITPVNIAMALGIVCGLTGLRPPAVAAEAVNMLAGCMSPVAMLVLGLTLSAANIGGVFRQKRTYLMAFLRLIAIPGIFGAVLYLLGVRGDEFFISVAVLALPVGLNAAVLTAAYGADSKTGAQYCLITHLFSLFTLPLVFGYLQSLA